VYFRIIYKRISFFFLGIFLGELHDLNSMNSNDSTTENNTNQQFLHPPE
jgi:hypothetical protein